MNAIAGHTKRSPSVRESQILELAAKGVTDKEIAAICGISTGTVRSHWNRIYPKLGAANRAEAISVYVGCTAREEIAELDTRLEAANQEVLRQGADLCELRFLKDQLESTIAGLPGLIWAVGATGEFQLLRGGDAEPLGLDRRDLAGRSAEEFLQTVMSSAERETVLAGKRITTLRLFRGKWLRTTLSCLRGQNGDEDAVVGLSVDMSEHSPHAFGIDPLLELVASITESFRFPAFILDGEVRKLVSANEPARRLVFDSGTVPSVGLEVIHPDDRVLAIEALESAVESGSATAVHGKTRLLNSGGPCVAGELRWAPLGPRNHEPHRYVLAALNESPAADLQEQDCLICSLLTDCSWPYLSS